jgi:LmbE family N-acetylglucosaminyl deacetylase
MAALRTQEQERSLAALGVTEHRWLGYVDGSLAEVRRSGAVDRLSALIDEVRPDTIVTFGPEGMTGHSDHRTVSAWATLAWRETGSRGRLWYSTLTPSFHRTWGAVNDEIGLWFDGAEPPVTRDEDLAAQVVCDEPLADLKQAALSAHASQVTGLIRAVGEERFRQWWSVESFVAASRTLAEVSRAGR